MPGRARDLYVAGLITARSMEGEGIHLLGGQIGRLSCRPDMQDALRRHLAESELQDERLGLLLEEMGVGTARESAAEPEGPIARLAEAAAAEAGEL
jgi:ferritin-like metal-binding protein YciE